jgi:predicted Zn finger-like uncharacterized protein
MTQLVTRCPQCSTSFRITPAQIQKARGAVRCGSCLHIFNAEQNLIEGGNPKPTERREKAAKRAPQTPPPTQAQLPINSEPELEVPPASATKPETTQAPSSARQITADSQSEAKPHNDTAPRPAASPTATVAPHEQDISSRKTETFDETPDISVKPTSSEHTINVSERELTPNANQEGLLRFDQAQIDLESELDDDVLISDDMDNPSTEPDSDLYVAPSDSSHSLFERRIEHRGEEFVDTSDESWAENLLDDDAPVPTKTSDSFDNPLSITRGEQPVTVTPPENNEQRDTDAFIDNYAANEHSASTELAASEEPLEPPPEKPPSAAPAPRFYLHADDSDEEDSSQEATRFGGQLRAYDSERSALLMGIDPEPVEMAGSHHHPWRKRLIWGGLCLLAALGLAAQIAWLQFDRYSRIEPYRSYYQSVCSLIGCQLPTLRDTSKVRAFNLVVRQHPEQSRALMIDAIILNSADFKQPYPALQLTFSDINDRPVASRVFTPKEYLRGELTGRTIMPSNQPVHLSLELSDPGPEAVNYSLVIP